MEKPYIDQIVGETVSRKNIFGAVLCVESGDGKLSQASAAGDLMVEKPYFIASVTKMYITAIILRLRSENRFHLYDKISNYLSSNILDNLHKIKGKDYSNEITVKHLMSNTSGISDYFSSKLVKELLSGKDQSWGFDKEINYAKQKEAKFSPGKRAHYSDTNYQLLGRIIELITDKEIETVLQEFIFDKLKLKETYVYNDENDTRPAMIYYKSQQIHVPKYLASIGPEGGIVSTAKESMIFMKAFMNGELFPKEYVSELYDWKILFGPGLFYYGVGIASQPLSLKEMKGALIGHWGQTGAFAFFHPKTDLYFTGTTNQFYGQNAAAKMMISIIKDYKKQLEAIH